MIKIISKSILFLYIMQLLFCVSIYADFKEIKLKIKPNVTYRQAFMKKNKSSVYHHPDHKDYLDQLYLSLKMIKSVGFDNEIIIEPAFRTPRTNPRGDIETVIDQAYIQASLSDVVVIVGGKKTEFYGFGFFDSPSDLLNENKDVFDDLYKREGKIFTKISFRISQMNNLLWSVGFVPRRGHDVRDGKKWLFLNMNVLNTDIELQYSYNILDKDTIGFALSKFFNEQIELHVDGRYQTRQRDNSDERDSEDKYKEMDFSVYKKNDKSWYYVLGTRFVLTYKRRLILEYIKKQFGLLKQDKEAYYQEEKSKMIPNIQVSDSPAPVSRLIGRNYLCLGYEDQQLYKKTKLGINAIYSLDDYSLFGFLEFKYIFSNITSISLAQSFFEGKKYSEFGEMPFKNVSYIILKGEF